MSYFPEQTYLNAGDYAKAYFERLALAAETVSASAMAAAGELLRRTAVEGRAIYSCGNGGSAAIANHLVCDCLKGVRNGTNLKPRVYSLSTTVELITAIVNDIGSEEMFSFQLESLGLANDVLIAISSSGASPNIVSALRVAKSRGMLAIAMTGFGGGEAASLADINLHVNSENYGLVEDTHQAMMHILAQYMRHSHLINPEQLGVIKF